MRSLILAVILAVPLTAHAQPPEMVVLPRSVVENAILDMQAVARLHPDLATPSLAQHFGELGACLADNPKEGRLVRQEADQCAAVTKALAEREKALAAAQQPPADKPPAKP